MDERHVRGRGVDCVALSNELGMCGRISDRNLAMTIAEEGIAEVLAALDGRIVWNKRVARHSVAAVAALFACTPCTMRLVETNCDSTGGALRNSGEDRHRHWNQYKGRAGVKWLHPGVGGGCYCLESSLVGSTRSRPDVSLARVV